MKKSIQERRKMVINKGLLPLTKKLPSEVVLEVKKNILSPALKVNTNVPKTRYGNEYENPSYDIFGKKLRGDFKKSDSEYGRKMNMEQVKRVSNPEDYLERNIDRNSMYLFNKRKIFD